MMSRALAFLFLLFMSGCVGGTLGDTSEFEMFPLRSASDSEAKELKRCLKTAHAAQVHLKKKTGKFARKVKDLPIDSQCSGFRLTQKGTPDGFEIRAELRESETTVRWSVNQDGVIEEHLDPESNAELDI